MGTYFVGTKVTATFITCAQTIQLTPSALNQNEQMPRLTATKTNRSLCIINPLRGSKDKCTKNIHIDTEKASNHGTKSSLSNISLASQGSKHPNWPFWKK